MSNGLIFYTSLGRTIDQDDNQQVIYALVFYYMRSRRLPALFADRIMQHFRHCRPHTHWLIRIPSGRTLLVSLHVYKLGHYIDQPVGRKSEPMASLHLHYAIKPNGPLSS